MSGGKNLNKQKRNESAVTHPWRKMIGNPITWFVMVFVLVLVLLGVSFLPAGQVKKRVALSDKVLQDAGLKQTDPQEQAFVEFTYPASGNEGDAMTVQANLNLGHYALTDPQSHLVAELILNMDNSQVNPDGEVLYPILGTYPAQASWKVIPFRDGSINGTLWIHLQVVKANTETQRYLLMSYPMEIQSISLLGLPIGIGRLILIAIIIICFFVIMFLGIKAWVGVRKP
jgi:hypothetical protein